MLSRIYFIALSFILILNAVSGQHQNVLSLSFESNSARLSDSAIKQLSDLSRDLQQNAYDQLVLSGHCDAAGNTLYNLKLSEKRVESVCNFLVRNGLKKEKIKKEYSGESSPVAANETPEGKMKNRRVDLSVQYVEKSQENPFRDFMQPVQYFQADGGKEIIIRGNQGTVISIPANAFETVNGENISGPLQIELKEFYRKSDFVMNAIPTVSDGKILETGGTVFISAKRGGEEVRLLPGKDIRLDMNYKGDFTGMQTFEGQVNAGTINWKPSGSAQSSFQTISPITYFDGDSLPVFGGAVSSNITASDSTFKSRITSNKLGWINCDRFANYRNLSSLKISFPNAPNLVRVALVFRNINSMLFQPCLKDGICTFYGVPVGSKVTVFAYSENQAGPLVNRKEITIGQGPELTMNLNPVTLLEFGEALNSLN